MQTFVIKTIISCPKKRYNQQFSGFSFQKTTDSLEKRLQSFVFDSFFDGSETSSIAPTQFFFLRLHHQALIELMGH